MKEMKTGVSFTPVSIYLPIFLQIIRHQHAAFQLYGNQLANRNDLVMQFFFSDFRTLGKFLFSLIMNTLQTLRGF
ncbi:MAG: hypothetical protein ACLSA6_06640 [Holdemania massiliensis]